MGLLGLGLLAWACTTNEAPHKGQSLAELDSIWYALPPLKYPLTVEMAEDLGALAQERLQAYEQPVFYSSDSLDEPLDHLRDYARVALAARNFALGQEQILAYQVAYDRRYIRPNAGGMLMHEYLWSQMAQDSLQAPSSSQVLRYLEALQDKLDEEEGWQMLSHLDWLDAATAQETLKAAITDLPDSATGNLVDDLLTSYWRMLVHRGLDSVSDEPRAAVIASKFGITDTVQIPMPDGTMLGGLLYLPKQHGGPVPTVLYVNCYPDGYVDALYSRMAASRGYAGLTVYNRGMGSSEGTFEPMEHDAEDNYHIIDWVSKQSWSNGQVGMTGGSYLGFAQWAALKHPHPALKTIVPLVSVGAGIDYPMQNGVFMPYMLQWLKYVTNDKQTDYETFADFDFWFGIYGKWYREGKSFREFDRYYHTGEQDKLFQRWLDHPDYDAFWQAMVPSSPQEFAAINIPILTITGYYDDDQLGALHYYRQHQQYGNPAAVANHHLVMGPWTHGGAQSAQGRSVYGIYLPYEATVDIPKLGFDWFDYIMRDGPKPALLQNRVNLYVMEQGWQHLPGLSAMADTARWYPQATEEQCGLLASNPIAGTATLREDFAPNTMDSVYFSSVLFHDSTFRQALQADHRLIWETAPLERPLTISGAPVATLSLTPQTYDVDLVVTWYEVKANGEVLRLSMDMERLSYIQDPTTRQLLVPNQPITVRMKDSFWMSRKIALGSRLRVSVHVQSSHEWMKNYGTGKAVAEEGLADYAPVALQLHLQECYFEWPLAPAE